MPRLSPPVTFQVSFLMDASRGLVLSCAVIVIFALAMDALIRKTAEVLWFLSPAYLYSTV